MIATLSCLPGETLECMGARFSIEMFQRKSFSRFSFAPVLQRAVYVLQPFNKSRWRQQVRSIHV